ncbi:hypothetical protein FH972_019595 [Carpinus fangiana]|uniref:Uncharacterized protein n=1 Tax=Carpinus fangiana TaxID=176857 RepID=A0A5N6RQR1_9ROSI|nr:hypothetical protein FH972_019595 [Carpinus fangiana]
MIMYKEGYSCPTSYTLIIYAGFFHKYWVSEAHLLSPGSSRMPRKIDRSIMLREMQVKIFHYYQRRMMLGAATQRVSPGGPDSQHH